jgi:Alpha-galactosidases/6-phospho-beta-glucosidases, family 4 of glycosyl hydrolases
VVNGSTEPWMPPQAIIETPTLVSGHGFVPLQPAETPLDLQALTRLNATFEMLWAEAVVEKDYGKALACHDAQPPGARPGPGQGHPESDLEILSY